MSSVQKVDNQKDAQKFNLTRIPRQKIFFRPELVLSAVPKVKIDPIKIKLSQVIKNVIFQNLCFLSSDREKCLWTHYS